MNVEIIYENGRYIAVVTQALWGETIEVLRKDVTKSIENSTFILDLGFGIEQTEKGEELI